MLRFLLSFIVMLNINLAHANPEFASIQAFVKEIFESNSKYVESNDAFYTDSTLKHQAPRATILMCSDSRLESKSIDNTPVGDIFVVRNIGNQISTAPGSIEYGVQNLKTPLLIIVGHTQCGAIKAGMSDFSKASENIFQELVTLKLDKKLSTSSNIIENVNNQVELAMKKFAHEVKNGDLTILGLLSDLHDEHGLGNGRLFIININNVTEPNEITQHPLLQGVNYSTIQQH